MDLFKFRTKKIMAFAIIMMMFIVGISSAFPNTVVITDETLSDDGGVMINFTSVWSRFTNMSVGNVSAGNVTVIGDFFGGNVTNWDNSLFPFYEQISAPTIADNSTSYWYDTDDNDMYQMVNSYGDEYQLNLEHVNVSETFIPAYIRIGSRSTIPVATGSVWENITFNHSCAGLRKGFSHTYSDNTNDTITVNNSGIYAITYFIACEDSAATPDAHVGFRLINATDQTIIKGSYGEFDTSKKDMYIFKEHSFITSFENGNQIKVQFTSDDTTVTLTPHVTFNPSGPSCQLSMHKIANN